MTAKLIEHALGFLCLAAAIAVAVAWREIRGEEIR